VININSLPTSSFANSKELNMSTEKKNNDIGVPKNLENKEHDENERLSLKPSREGLRPRICASQLRRFHLCICGRPRALIRHGHRWQRLGTCQHCLTPVSSTNPVDGRSLHSGGSRA
jgi:hypothetical protein